jgi:hypothetical protein
MQRHGLNLVGGCSDGERAKLFSGQQGRSFIGILKKRIQNGQPDGTSSPSLVISPILKVVNRLCRPETLPHKKCAHSHIRANQPPTKQRPIKPPCVIEGIPTNVLT